MHIVIYTDGACEPNPGEGGWAAIVVGTDNQERILSGRDPQTTNNRMELMGPIVGLESVTEDWHITVVSDSQYVVRGVNEWMPNWKKHRWRRSGKSVSEVKNVDLWKRLDAAIRSHRSVKFLWVRGHNGHEGNERADKIATAAIRGVEAGESS